MYEQCFSIELKPWRKPSDKRNPRKKEEGGRGIPGPGHMPQHKMNEMYEQCFPTELKNHRENLSPYSCRRRSNQKSSFPRTEKSQISCTNKRPNTRRLSKHSTKSPSPSLAGQTATVDRAVLLAPGHRSSASSQGFAPVTNCGFAR